MYVSVIKVFFTLQILSKYAIVDAMACNHLVPKG